MFKIGMIGMGKLGFPVALAMDSLGHDVAYYDPLFTDIIHNKKFDNEKGANELLKKSQLSYGTPESICSWADIVFIAVQTPHGPEYEGITPLPETRSDFDYSYLIEAVKSCVNAKVLVVISTVLPGTVRRELMPIKKDIIYNPYFIAMGTVIDDFLNPEFTLIGSDEFPEELNRFYKTIHNKPLFNCTVEEAEIIKVSYNTYITAKICLANTIMELSHKVGNADCDVVTKALGMATDRIVSSKYMSGGMGDGGGCHPRDNIALSFLAKKLNLSYDIYESLLKCREEQTKWLAELCGNKVNVLGMAFKENTGIKTGSAAVLLTHYLKDYMQYDPYVHGKPYPTFTGNVYFIATKHNEFKHIDFPEGSIVIDPFRYIIPKDHFTLIRIGDR